jgi:hypothetical protein
MGQSTPGPSIEERADGVKLAVMYVPIDGVAITYLTITIIFINKCSPIALLNCKSPVTVSIKLLFDKREEWVAA